MDQNHEWNNKISEETPKNPQVVTKKSKVQFINKQSKKTLDENGNEIKAEVTPRSFMKAEKERYKNQLLNIV